MRTQILTLAFILLTGLLFGQNENPYSQFGYEAPVMPEKERPLLQNRMDRLYLINTDTASTVHMLAIDPSKRNITVFDKKGLVLQIDTLNEYTMARWLSVDPKGQFSSPYVGMGNNPISGTDPNGAYSWFGAFWRSLFTDGASEIYESGEGVWGFNTAVDGEAGALAHFGSDARTFLQDPIFLKATAMAAANYWNKTNTWPKSPGNIDFDAGTQLTLGFMAQAPAAALLRSSGAVAAQEGLAYRAINSSFKESTLKNGFFKSGAAGRLGGDGIYANTTVEGAMAEFEFHNPGVQSTVFEVRYPVSPTLKINPPSGYFSESLPFTKGVNILEAPSLRFPGSTNLLIRDGAVPGSIIK